MVLVRHGATYSTEDGLLSGTSDEEASTLGEVQNEKTAEMLMDLELHNIYYSPLRRCRATAERIRKFQVLAGFAEPAMEAVPQMVNIDVGVWQGKPAADVKGQPVPEDAEPTGDFT